jgi:hypothetical protein
VHHYWFDGSGLGRVGTPQVLLPVDRNTEAAQTDSWDRSSPTAPAEGLELVLDRVVYNSAGDKILYRLQRTVQLDGSGRVKTISAETQVTIDEPTECLTQ